VQDALSACAGRVAAVFLVCLMIGKTSAQMTQPSDAASTAPACEPPSAEKKPAAAPQYSSKAYGTRLENAPNLRYVRTLDQSGIPGTQDMSWLELGLEHRTRFNYRVDDYQREPPLGDDSQFLLRTLGYIGIREILDPLRFGFEFQDARQFNSILPPNNQDTDENDITQMFLELYFPDVFGTNEPFRFQFGRMTFDYADRRLIARNIWRNTTSFDGFRFQLGEWTSDWQLDFFAVQPVERFLRQPNHGDEERWFFGIEGAWRRWHEFIILEPYYLILAEQHDERDIPDREIHTLGIHAFGPIGKTGFDYDLAGNYQFGHDGDLEHRAFATHGELGYTFKHDWKPRLSFYNEYASGDRSPGDSVNERFDRLFNAAHPFSTSDFFNWQNIIVNKLRIDLQPHKTIRFDAAYGTYWLASDTDAWVIPRRRDPTGQSGDFVGQEFEARLRWQLDPRIEVELGYSHFMPGDFVQNTGESPDADFFYVQTTFQLFK
jgi:hypothetical protein